jgi:RNAse (barnase) inhibitor barstar
MSRLISFVSLGRLLTGRGYFGKCGHSFDDCLFEKFGLEFPSTIVWKHYSETKELLPDFCEDLVEAMQTVHDRQAWYNGAKQAIELVFEDND